MMIHHVELFGYSKRCLCIGECIENKKFSGKGKLNFNGKLCTYCGKYGHAIESLRPITENMQGK